MSANKHLIALAISTVLAIGQSALAQEPAGDSAYQWGRWAVLSPASGGEPFRAPDAPGADFNVRPGDLYGPEVASFDAPPQRPIAVPGFPPPTGGLRPPGSQPGTPPAITPGTPPPSGGLRPPRP